MELTRALQKCEHECPPSLLYEFNVFMTAREDFHCPAWELDPDLPRGGLYWLSRAHVFRTASHEAAAYAGAVADAERRAGHS